MDCSQEQFPSLNVTVESQLIDEINDGDSENPKVALSLKCVDHMTNITSYHNGSYVVSEVLTVLGEGISEVQWFLLTHLCT